MGSRLVWIVFALAIGYSSGHSSTEVTLGVAPEVDRMAVERDGGVVVLSLDATTGKSISWPVSPGEARQLADLLYECADKADAPARPAPIDL